jgi:hypothetical protein
VRRILFVLCLALAAASTEACNRGPTTSVQERRLSAMEPNLTRDLTPTSARTKFGAPDEVTGSGLIIYKYRVDGGRTLWLGFPGEAAISYARLEAKDGSFTDLPLR